MDISQVNDSDKKDPKAYPNMKLRCHGVGTLFARQRHQEAAGGPRHAGQFVGLDSWGAQGTDLAAKPCQLH